MSMYKVVKIMDDMNIIINGGSKNGIIEGDRFYIYSKDLEIVKDPDTKETLGEFKKIKAKIEAVAVYEKMCICQNAKISASLSEMTANAFNIGGKRLALNVDPAQISGGRVADDDEMIQIGDEVEIIKKSN